MAAMSRTSAKRSFTSPRRRNRLLLEHLQQLRLHLQIHVADLVEKQRASVRDLEEALLRRDRAGERAALVAEQLRLEQLLRQPGAVQIDERLLPRAGRCRAASRASTPLPVPVSPWIRTGRSVGDDPAARPPRAARIAALVPVKGSSTSRDSFVAVGQIGLPAALRVERALEDHEQRRQLDRLRQELLGPFLDRADRQLDRWRAR